MAGTAEIAAKLAGDYNLTVTSAKELSVAVLDTIVEMAKTERIQIGKHIFKPYTRAERTGRNPKTGESLVIPEKSGVKYKYTGDKVKVLKVAPKPESKSKKKK